jgi:hypothetical protein
MFALNTLEPRTQKIKLSRLLHRAQVARPDYYPALFPGNPNSLGFRIAGDSLGDGRFCGWEGKRDPSHLIIPVCADPRGCATAYRHNDR